MTRVDFYVLPDVDLEARRRFACRLAHKAVAAGQHVHVHVADADAGADFDALMWEYPDHRFLAHGITGEPASNNAPVLIDHREPAPGADQVLINLGSTIPSFFGRFERIIEIVVQNVLEDGRVRYKYYRDRGYPLEYRKIEPSDDR